MYIVERMDGEFSGGAFSSLKRHSSKLLSSVHHPSGIHSTPAVVQRWTLCAYGDGMVDQRPSEIQHSSADRTGKNNLADGKEDAERGWKLRRPNGQNERKHH